MIGRVRPSDGFFSLSKEYVRRPTSSLLPPYLFIARMPQVDDDRGRWLYRGYMIGDTNGNLSGRWRDTLTVPQEAGYEGCFVMSRRR